MPGAPTDLTGWIASRSRTWLDLASVLDVDNLIVIGDQLVRIPRHGGAPLATRQELQALCEAHPRARGIGRAREALEQVRVGADSPPETKMRLALIRSGLPEPELQISPSPENPYAPKGDLGYRQLSLVLQYEGGHHRTPEQYSRDLNREREWASYGWSSLRYDVSDLRSEFARAIVEVDRRFRRI
ncbi:hypothetical protein GCM10008096_02580 [Zhihengliuella salsuginis]|uniref:DUF559 domain-containing protein n=1 Tax=Zhihengliuella salsuginis TaxID=578222 RepID=A0ABQ3GBX8_9MICC|nr:hypothetical protein GCM10008096_02580 [Zhihengliuella salsuginis]